jgi:hypothetical protein
MKLVPLTVSVNDAAPAVADDGESKVMVGVGFGVRKLRAPAEPGSVIAASARMLMSGHGPRNGLSRISGRWNIGKHAK